MVTVQDRYLLAATGLGLGLAALATTGCMGSPESLAASDHRIVDGQPTTGSPATVYLDLGFASCTGTLVSPKVVLTAAHCLEDVNSVRVFFGSNADGQGTRINAVDWEIHPQADIAILTMASPGPTEPVPVFGGAMGSLTSHLQASIHIVGFGVTSENGSDSGLKREGYTKLHRLQGGIMFTGSDLSGSWTCYGDSGGPNYMTLGGKEVVVGVTSFGTMACGTPEDGAVRTDTYYQWIQDYIAANDPQVCPADGQCETDCGGAVDPDCATAPDCSPDGTCNAECGADRDPDCNVPDCDQDNVCNEECTVVADPDCDGGDDSSDSTDSTDSTDASDSTDANDGNSTDDDADGSDDSADGSATDNPSGNTLSGGCSTTGGEGGAGGAWLLVLGAVLAARRRRT